MFADGTLMAIFLFETLMFLLIPALIILLIYCIFLAIKALKISKENWQISGNPYLVKGYGERKVVDITIGLEESLDGKRYILEDFFADMLDSVLDKTLADINRLCSILTSIWATCSINPTGKRLLASASIASRF